MPKSIKVKDIRINVKISKTDDDFICLTDIARRKNPEDPRFVVQNWMSNRFTIEFMGIWEQIHNANFNRVLFDTFRNEAGSNSFSMSPDKWVKSTNAVGIISRPGRYGGGTYAHRDIAFEFASWISPEFKLYLVKEFQRLKSDEAKRLVLGWDTKRLLTKINYRIHTDAIKAHLIPGTITKAEADIIYANEADVLNKALFGMTAKEWRDAHPKADGNIRDYADVTQLVCLANLENLNAEYIRTGLEQPDRLLKLNASAITQMKSLIGSPSIKRLK
ncbi:MAG: KilA-N domain-containing protein [Patescibacteria group bacterium]|nr:KilA-N domain-containing protein [Patescibacteria group bacterium]